MKHEYIAGALILIIMIASIINTNYVENKTRTLSQEVESAETLYFNGDGTEAVERIKGSLENWLGWDSYAHIMLRHSEVDLVTDAYFELLSELQSEETVPEASFSKLKQQLYSISIMEQITVGSVF